MSISSPAFPTKWPGATTNLTPKNGEGNFNGVRALHWRTSPKKGSGPAFWAPPFEIRWVSGAMVDIGLGPTDGFLFCS